MSKPISRLWILGPPAAILLSLLVYYAKFNVVRQWVDVRFPWVKENVGSRLPQLAEQSSSSRRGSGAASTSIPNDEPPPVSSSPPPALS
jgi:hypothetical protein